MKITQSELVRELRQKVRECAERATELRALDDEVLQWRQSDERWSVLECIEHLNRYGAFYLPEIERRLESAKSSGKQSYPGAYFHYSGWGNFFVNAVSPQPADKIKKMNAFKKLNPHHQPLQRDVLDLFLRQQAEMLALLDRVERFDLARIRTATTIPMVRLRLGDTLRAEIYHNQRHLNQAFEAVRERERERERA